MENKPKFNLKDNIQIWKSELSQNANLTLDNVNELESHLYDEIDELQQLGLSTEESLLIAKKRIGEIKDLTTEFSKVNDGIYFRNKIIPYLKGILLFMAFTTMINVLVNLFVIIASKIGVNSEYLNYIPIGTFLILSLALLILTYNKYKDRSFNFSILTNIPFLVVVVLVGKFLTISSSFFLTLSGQITMSDFGYIQSNIGVYNLLFVLFILIVSFVVFYLSKRENKIRISD